MILHEAVLVPPYIDEVVHGLTSRPKTLPCKLFYDDRGSQLFEEITRLPEYYPTRTEMQILSEHGNDIAAAVGERAAIVELGSGAAIKVRVLLDRENDKLAFEFVPADAKPRPPSSKKKPTAESV